MTASEIQRTTALREGEGTEVRSVTLADLHAANIARQAEWCAGGDPEPDLAFRGNELAGETGEACNVIKKLERERHGWRGSRATKDQLAEELADVVICADLCAVTAGIDLGAAVVAKFNATSEKVGLSTKLAAAPSPDRAGDGGDQKAGWPASYQETFDAIAAAVTIHSDKSIGISVKAFYRALSYPDCGDAQSGFTAAVPSDQWRPIETAPKDGRRIIGTKPGWAATEYFCFVTPHNAWRNEAGRVLDYRQPTLWIPWPEPPASADGGPQGEDAGAAESRSDASAVGRKAETPSMSVDEAREVLVHFDQNYEGGAQEALEFAKWMATRDAVSETGRYRFLETASRIKAALRTLSEHGEVR